MSRRGLLFLLAAVPCISACGTGPVEPPRTLEEFFPLEDGRIYAFRTSSAGGNASVSLKDESRGHGYWGLDFWGGSSGRFTLGLLRDDSGLGIMVIGMGHGAMPLDPPLLSIPPSVAEGVPWTSRAGIGSKKPEIQAEMARELERHPEMKSIEFSTHGSAASAAITAGGKTYQARSVELRLSATTPQGKRGDGVFARLWIAPGVGIVQVDLGEKGPKDPSPTQTWELTDVRNK